MWLLDTTTLQLKRFYGRPPAYAILSHRWEDGQELEFGDVTAASAHLKGHQKVVNFCEKARYAGFQYGWADTCCIDQKSSAELSEAINSMFRWYRDAGVCYAFLADVKSKDDLRQSSWFTRGWTLQELIAPSVLQFLDYAWMPLGSKSDLANELEQITKVPNDALQRFRTNQYCVAEIMSWAADRKTTREEDRAYSLLGLFDINMPMLYGEGAKAFQRLQEEIMKTSTDTSLFLWDGLACDTFGMLASDPSCFSITHVYKRVRSHCRHPQYSFTPRRESHGGWTVNNAGMSITGALLQSYLALNDVDRVYFVSLPYHNGSEERAIPEVGFFVMKIRDAGKLFPSAYRRVAVDGKASSIITPRATHVLLPPPIPTLDLFIAREPLSVITCTEDTGPRGFVVRLLTVGNVKSVARSRSTAPLVQHWPISPQVTEGPSIQNGNLHLLVWNSRFRNDKSINAADYYLLVEPEDAKGLLCYFTITVNDFFEIFIGFGFDQDLKPFCIVIPFCNKLLGRPLDAEDVLQVHTKLMSMRRTERHGSSLARDDLVFDGPSQMMARLGDTRAAEVYKGLEVDVKRRTHAVSSTNRDGKHGMKRTTHLNSATDARIEVQPDVFIKEFLGRRRQSAKAAEDLESSLAADRDELFEACERYVKWAPLCEDSGSSWVHCSLTDNRIVRDSRG